MLQTRPNAGTEGQAGSAESKEKRPMIDKQEFFEKYNLDNRDLAEAKLTWEELENKFETKR